MVNESLNSDANLIRTGQWNNPVWSQMQKKRCELRFMESHLSIRVITRIFILEAILKIERKWQTTLFPAFCGIS